ncbi:MAG: HAD family hydrolase [Syntrophotaleaceae bacterium]
MADPIKETTPEAIEQLHRRGIRIVMLTGDNLSTAKAAANQLIDDVQPGCLADKAAKVKELQDAGEFRRRAGDGNNDALGPWLKPTSESPWAPAPT